MFELYNDFQINPNCITYELLCIVVILIINFKRNAEYLKVKIICNKIICAIMFYVIDIYNVNQMSKIYLFI